MYLKKLLALLLSAALALSLLAGCGGESVALSLLALLDGKYANVSVEMDPDLEADLRQAIRTAESENAGDDAAAIRAALETLLGSKVTFRKLGEGQQGDTAFDLIFYAGADPDKAAQSAYSQWNGTFSNLPDDGLYTAALAQVQTENGVWLLVQATVDKAGTVDKPDKDDDDDEPEKPKQPYEVTGTNDNGQVTNVTVNASNGLENLFTKQEGEAQEITAARAGGFAGVTIELAAGETYTVSQTFAENNGTFKGILKGESKETTTITLTGGNGLFKQISGGTVENITFEVQTAISNTYSDGGTTRAGAVAGQNNGIIQNCDVTINAGGSITADGDGKGDFYAGAVAGQNNGTIQNCDVTINAGSITAANDINGDVYAGGIAGENRGTISNCHVEGSYKGTGDAADISAADGEYATCAGGIAGCNQGTGAVVAGCSVSNCKIKAGDYGQPIAAGGLVGLNEEGSVPSTSVSVTGCYYITATARNAGDATVTNNSEGSTAYNPNAWACASAKIGCEDNTGRPVGW